MERRVLQHWCVLFVLLPEASFQVSQDHDPGLDAVWCHVIVALDGHDAHGRDGLGHGMWEAVEAAVLLEDDLHVGVVFKESILLLVLGVQPRRSIDEVLV